MKLDFRAFVFALGFLSPAAAQSIGTTVSMSCPRGIEEARMMITMLGGLEGPVLLEPVGFNCGSASLYLNRSNKAIVKTDAEVAAVSYVIDVILPVGQAGRCEGTVASPTTILCAGKFAVTKGVGAVKVNVSRSN